MLGHRSSEINNAHYIERDEHESPIIAEIWRASRLEVV